MSFTTIPWLLTLLILPTVLVVTYVFAHRARMKKLKAFANHRLLSELLSSYSPTKSITKQVFIVVALLLVITALGRPYWGYDWAEVSTKGIDVIFVLDASKSMLAEDIKPNRLKRSKYAILDFVEQLEGDRIGLVAFSGSAFLQCPLTLDYDAFRQSLDAVDTDIIPLGGTDISAAIEETQTAFSNDNNFKIIVMITDGEDLEESGIKRAQQAAGKGVTIYTVGVGTENGGLIPIGKDRGHVQYLKDEKGDVVKTKLDEATLTKIAESTGGFYRPLGSTGTGLKQVYEYGLKTIPEQELASRMERVNIEIFQGFLGAAIFFLCLEPLIGNRKKRRASQSNAQSAGIAALLLIGLSLAAPQSLEAASGESFLKAGDFEKAIESFNASLEDKPDDSRLRYNLGLAHYYAGDNHAAIESWELSLDSEKLEQQQDTFYNMGNARYRIGREAIGAIEIEDGFEENFLGNVAIAEEAKKLGTQSMGRDPQGRKEVWDQLEAVKKAMDDGIKTAETIKKDLDKPIKQWAKGIEHYESALELSAEQNDEDTLFNKGFVEKKAEALKGRVDELAESIELQKKLSKELEAIIAALKAPTSRVIDAKTYAEQLLKAGRFKEAYSILAGTAQEDPTAEVYKEKQERVGQVVGILEPEATQGAQP